MDNTVRVRVGEALLRSGWVSSFNFRLSKSTLSIQQAKKKSPDWATASFYLPPPCHIQLVIGWPKKTKIIVTNKINKILRFIDPTNIFLSNKLKLLFSLYTKYTKWCIIYCEPKKKKLSIILMILLWFSGIKFKIYFLNFFTKYNEYN